MTVEQWLRKLKEPYRSQALRDAKKTRPQNLTIEVDSVAEAIMYGVAWSRATRLDWCDVHDIADKTPEKLLTQEELTLEEA